MHCNFTPFPVLSTERLVLRQITLDDDKEIFFQRSDKGMNAHVDNPLAQTIEDAHAWINRITENIVNNEAIAWGVTLKDEPKLIGGFCFWNMAKELSRAEIGFSIYPDHQGKGLMKEVLAEGIRFGFEDMGLKTIEAYTHPQNAPSIAVLEKSGFRLIEKEHNDTQYIVFELRREHVNP